MKTTTCRDCGYQVEAGARGCPQCALNLEAEWMIDHFIWRRIVPTVTLLGILAAAALIYFVR